jgi:hypothetical protein
MSATILDTPSLRRRLTRIYQSADCAASDQTRNTLPGPLGMNCEGRQGKGVKCIGRESEYGWHLTSFCDSGSRAQIPGSGKMQRFRKLRRMDRLLQAIHGHVDDPCHTIAFQVKTAISQGDASAVARLLASVEVDPSSSRARSYPLS